MGRVAAVLCFCMLSACQAAPRYAKAPTPSLPEIAVPEYQLADLRAVTVEARGESAKVDSLIVGPPSAFICGDGFLDGFLDDSERYRKIFAVWTGFDAYYTPIDADMGRGPYLKVYKLRLVDGPIRMLR